MNIYVGKLALETTEDDLREAFQPFGEIGTVRIIRDGTSGESRGFGFVEMPNDEEGNTAITELNGKEIKGSEISVEKGRGKPAGGRMGGGRRPRGQGRPRGGGGPGGRQGGRGGGRGPSRGRSRF